MRALLLLLLWLGNGSAAADRPNLIVVLADDQSFETISALGYCDVQTPHLDALLRRGTTFTRAYNMGSWTGAVCVASRTMLNTGRFLWRARSLEAELSNELAGGRLWSQRLGRVGYRTYFSGKWHVNCAVEAAFDVVRHIRPGMPNQTPAGYDRPRPGVTDEWSPSDPRFGGYWQGGRHWSEVLVDDALLLLQEASTGDQPFLLYLAFNAPHDPRQSPQAFLDRYPVDRVDIPVNFLPAYPFRDMIGCSAELRDERLAPFPRTEHAVRVHRREYYASITHMDEQIGRLLRALDASPHRLNTYLFFTADQGLAVGHHGLFGKQNMYDHSVRVPFLVVGPGIPGGRRIDAPIYLQDIVPTSLELAGAEMDEIDFRSLMPLIRGDAAKSYEAIYGAYMNLQRMITADGYKLIVYPWAKRLRLYHLARDPDELIDLSGQPSYRPVIRRLLERLVQCQSEAGDPLDLQTCFVDWL